MSKSALRQRISKALIENFNRVSDKTVGQAARVLLQSAEVRQCLVVNPKAMRALQTGFEAAIGETLSNDEGKTYRRKLKAFLKTYKQPFPHTKDQHTKFFKKLVDASKLKFDDTVLYIPTTFDTIKGYIKAFNQDFFEKRGGKGKFDPDKKFGDTTHIDHGADGAASGLVGAIGGSFAVKQKSTRKFPKNFVKVLEKNFTAVMDNSLNDLTKKHKDQLIASVMELVVVAEQIISTGGDVRAGISMILTPILKAENIERGSKEEAAVQEAFLQAFEMTFRNIDYATLKGSSTLVEKVEKFIVVDVFEKELKRSKRAKVQTQSRNTKSSTKTEDKGNTKKGRKTHSAKPINRGGALASGPAVKRAARHKSDANIQNILGILNNKLPETVRKNMGDPALRNRTGRFSNSVKITDITKTPTGMPSIGYTYDRDNYGQYEASSGSRYASTERDPRRLIDRSVREIAANMAIGRFYTRRV